MDPLGARHSDELCHPDANDEDADQCGDSANPGADGLDEVDATNDLIVLFFCGGKSIFTKEKLVGFVLREVPAIDHQTDECCDENAPDCSHNGESVHDMPQKKVMSWSGIPSEATGAWRRWVGRAGNAKHTPVSIRL